MAVIGLSAKKSSFAKDSSPLSDNGRLISSGV